MGKRTVGAMLDISGVIFVVGGKGTDEKFVGKGTICAPNPAPPTSRAELHDGVCNGDSKLDIRRERRALLCGMFCMT